MPRPTRLLRLALASVALAATLAPAALTRAQGNPDSIAQRTLACVACHGKEGRAGSDAYYPRIAGKPAGYLFNQLVNFREGRRRYALMTYLVDQLPDAYLREIADYFSGTRPPYPPPEPAVESPQVMARGRALVMDGDPARELPACTRCHGKALTGVMPAIPGLLGLTRDYLRAQLGAWKAGTRHAAPPDCMARIVDHLTPADVGAVAAWLSAQPLPADATAIASDAALPLRCGSAPQAVEARAR